MIHDTCIKKDLHVYNGKVTAKLSTILVGEKNKTFMNKLQLRSQSLVIISRNNGSINVFRLPENAGFITTTRHRTVGTT